MVVSTQLKSELDLQDLNVGESPAFNVSLEATRSERRLKLD